LTKTIDVEKKNIHKVGQIGKLLGLGVAFIIFSCESGIFRDLNFSRRKNFVEHRA
jgi:hypothetical protein